MRFHSSSFFVDAGMPSPQIRISELAGSTYGIVLYICSAPFDNEHVEIYFRSKKQLIAMADSLHEQVVKLQNEADIEAAEKGRSDE